jgi:hypothetical protein
MKSVRGLRAEAREAAALRGHTLMKFSHLYGTGWSAYAVASCRRCRAQVRVEPYPAPNAISIGGEAVALNCV